MRFITIRKTQVLRIVIAIANNVCYNMYKPYCYAELRGFGYGGFFELSPGFESENDDEAAWDDA